MKEYIPYTYLIRSLQTGDVYYGVKFAKGCTPSQFWKKYFTSSKVVAEMIEWYGKDSFVFEIRKTFKTKDEALKWEQTVLRRMKVKHGVNIWLNKHDSSNNFKFHNSEYTAERLDKIRVSSSGRKHSEETKRKISEGNKGKVHSYETKAIIGAKIKAACEDPEYIKRLSESHKGIKTSEKQKESVRESNKRRYKEGKTDLTNFHNAKKKRVMCEGVEYSSVTEAQNAYPGRNIYKWLKNPNHPEFYRIEEEK